MNMLNANSFKILLLLAVFLLFLSNPYQSYFKFIIYNLTYLYIRSRLIPYIKWCYEEILSVYLKWSLNMKGLYAIIISFYYRNYKHILFIKYCCIFLFILSNSIIFQAISFLLLGFIFLSCGILLYIIVINKNIKKKKIYFIYISLIILSIALLIMSCIFF